MFELITQKDSKHKGVKMAPLKKRKINYRNIIIEIIIEITIK